MIIWINGAFGSGKTQTAFELNRRLENSYVYDPENVGYFLRRNMPREIIRGNFQHQPLWRIFNYEIIKNIYTKYNGNIIIPMTIYNKEYYDEIIGKLLRENIKIDHYILGADKETLLKRLSKRHEKKNSWAAKHIDICINGFNELKEKSIYIDTNKLSIYDVVEKIGQKSNLKLKDDKDIEIIKKIKKDNCTNKTHKIICINKWENK
ncbi:tunicamycin resistance protein [Spirochaetia bacterium]|nr:tunicamycin resistance protein [Spirochaetia bacterium]